MNFHIKHFNELTTRELYDIFKLRIAVFIVEQDCVYQDADELDFDAYHLWLEESGELLAYCRILALGVKFPDATSIGRVISVIRGKGYGAEIVKKGIEHAEKIHGTIPIKIQAQKYAEVFYEKCGFETTSGIFPVDNIPHVEMVYRF